MQHTTRTFIRGATPFVFATPPSPLSKLASSYPAAPLEDPRPADLLPMLQLRLCKGGGVLGLWEHMAVPHTPKPNQTLHEGLQEYQGGT